MLGGRQRGRPQLSRKESDPLSSPRTFKPSSALRMQTAPRGVFQPTRCTFSSFTCKIRDTLSMQPIKTKRRMAIWSRTSIPIMAAHRAPPRRGIVRGDINNGQCAAPSPPPPPSLAEITTTRTTATALAAAEAAVTLSIAEQRATTSRPSTLDCDKTKTDPAAA